MKLTSKIFGLSLLAVITLFGAALADPAPTAETASQEQEAPLTTPSFSDTKASLPGFLNKNKPQASATDTTLEMPWQRHATLQNSTISLPPGYSASAIGLTANIGEVQSFSNGRNSSLQHPYFVMDFFFKNEMTPAANAKTYFSNAANAQNFHQYFIQSFESRVFYPKSSWEDPVVNTINDQAVLTIKARYIGQNHHNHYIWAHESGFFVLTAYYDDRRVPNPNEMIQKVLDSFVLPPLATTQPEPQTEFDPE
jgi:hypothetical protein